MNEGKSKGLPMATAGQRLWAGAIDLFVFSTLALVVRINLTHPLADIYFSLPEQQNTFMILPPLYTGFFDEVRLQLGLVELPYQMQIWFMVIYAVVGVVYFAVVAQLFEGRTIGKVLCGIKIVTDEGDIPLFSTLVLRNTIGYIISAAIGMGGFIPIFSNSNHDGRGLHDCLAKTRVVQAEKRKLYDDTTTR